MKSMQLTESERRQSQRFVHQASIMHETGDNGIFHKAQLVNYSSGGCCFETGVVHHPGDIVHIDFEDSPYTDSSAASEGHRAQVVWCQKILHRNQSLHYGVGVKYDESFN